jgi:hypothetical protein
MQGRSCTVTLTKAFLQHPALGLAHRRRLRAHRADGAIQATNVHKPPSAREIQKKKKHYKPKSTHLEQPEGLDAVVFVDCKAVVDARREDKEITRLNGKADPRIGR